MYKKTFNQWLKYIANDFVKSYNANEKKHKIISDIAKKICLENKGIKYEEFGILYNLEINEI